MLSICLLTKNSQDDLSRLLPSLSFASEIVLIDDYSSDNTVHLASAHGCRVFKRKLADDFSAQRNYALQKAKGPWVLFLDPDEKLSERLPDEIMKVISSGLDMGYQIRRLDIFAGQTLKHGETGHLWLTRLGHKKAGTWRRPVHEVWDIIKPVRLNHPIYHYSHPDLASFIRKINFYSDLESNYRLSQKLKTSLWQVLAFPAGKFMQNYILRLGFLDGFPGLIMAFMMSLHSFLVRSKMLTAKRS